jgi:hypothetical protein
VKRMLATLGIWASLAAQTLPQRTMFSGTGRVDSNPVPFSPPDVMVDMGAFGVVECPGSGVQPGLRPGDRVTISGSVSAAATAALIHELNGIAATLNYPDAITKEQDTVYLIANSCRVTKEIAGRRRGHDYPQLQRPIDDRIECG